MLALPARVFTHFGPLFPILVDQPVPGDNFTVPFHPDARDQAVVNGVYEPANPGPPPAVAEVAVWVRPLSRRLSGADYPATVDSGRCSLPYVRQPDLAAVERRILGVDIQSADGTKHHFVTQVHATPPGIGPWGLLLFQLTLLLLSGQAGLVLFRRRPRRWTPSPS